MGKSALLFDFIKAYAVDGIEDYFEGVICCGCRMGEERKAGNQTTEDRRWRTEIRGQRSEVRGRKQLVTCNV